MHFISIIITAVPSQLGDASFPQGVHIQPPPVNPQFSLEGGGKATPGLVRRTGMWSRALQMVAFKLLAPTTVCAVAVGTRQAWTESFLPDMQQVPTLES